MDHFENRQNPQGEVQANGVRGAYKEHLKKPFLDAFRKTGTICEAAESVGINRDTIAGWRESDEIFSKEFETANVDITERLESTAFNRAVNGTERPVFFRDREIGKVKEFSDSLLMFLLKSRAPQKYQEKFTQSPQVSEKFITQIVGDVSEILRRGIPDNCPDCKTHLGFKNNLAQELEAFSQKLIS